MPRITNLGASAVAGFTVISGLTLTTVRLYTEFQDSQNKKLEALVSKNEKLIEKCAEFKEAVELLKTRALDSEVPVVLEQSNSFFGEVPVLFILKGVVFVGLCVYAVQFLNSGSLVAHLNSLTSSMGLSRAETTFSGIDSLKNSLILKQDFSLNHGEKGVSLFFGDKSIPINVGELLADSASLVLLKKAYEKSSLEAILEADVQEKTLAKQETLINEKLNEISRLQHQIDSLGIQIAELRNQILGTGTDAQALSDMAFAALLG